METTGVKREPALLPIPSLVLVVCLVLTGLATYLARQMAGGQEESRLELAIREMEDAIESRIKVYVALLRGASALFAVDNSISREDFKRYIDQLELPSTYAGIQGIGFTQRVRAEERDDLIAGMRGLGFTNFVVWPEEARAEYHAIVYLEPFDRRNAAALGYDMFTHPVRRAAMEKARDTGLPAGSGKVQLVQEIDEQKQPGFLIYMPVYEGGVDPGDAVARRERLLGFVYSPFRAHDLLKGIFRGQSFRSIPFQVYDGPGVTAEGLLYESAGWEEAAGRMEMRGSLEVAGRPWTLIFRAGPHFESGASRLLTPMVATGGMALSFLFFTFYTLQRRAWQRSERIAGELRASEQQLQARTAEVNATSKRLRDMISNVPGIVWEARGLPGSDEEEVTYVSPYAERFLGYTQEEWLGKHRFWSEIVHPEDRRRAQDEFRALYQRRQAGVVQLRWRRKDGAHVWVEAHCTVIADEAGQPVGMRGVTMDISQRKKAESELEFLAEAGAVLSESLNYRSTLSNLARLSVPRLADVCLIDIMDPQKGIERLEAVSSRPENARLAEQLRHFAPNAAATRGVAQVLRSGKSEVYASLNEAFLKEVAQNEEHFRLLEGLRIRAVLIVPLQARKRVFGAMSFLLTDSARQYGPAEINLAEELARRAGLAIDNSLLYHAAQQEIAERRQAQADLSESEERFRLIMERTEEYAIILADPSGFISQWNPGATRILGYSAEEAKGKHLSMIFTPEDRAEGAPEEEISRALQTGQSLDERWHWRKNSSRFWGSGLLVALRDHSGNLRGFAKMMRDLTQQKRAKEAVESLNMELERRVRDRTAALKESNEQMEAFCYTVAHDLRAPLRAMQGFSQALLEDYKQAMDEMGRDYAQRIVDAAHRMDMLIQDLLSYSRLTRTDLAFETVNLEALIERGMDELLLEIREKKAKVEVRKPIPAVMGHASTIEQVINNLLSNALKFVHPERAPHIQIYAEERGERVRVWIEDNGIGIEPQYHERIFRVFERLYGIESYPGTGIGLAIVRKGIERMGGAVGVESVVGEGSKFWFELPKAEWD